MSRKFIISAMTLSLPGTMGGNSKITLEMARCLVDCFDVHFIVPSVARETFENYFPNEGRIHLHVTDTYANSGIIHPIGISRFYVREIFRVFEEIKPDSEDFVYGCGDFFSEFAPGYVLQKRYGYRWLPSAYLFIPGAIENLRRGYGFPVFLYSLAWLYARFYVFFASRRAAGFVITNKDDFRHFPKRFRAGRLFPFYGGVNVEQIPVAAVEKSRDVVFCSRLCTQKGILDFLDVWKIVHGRLPSARFTVIGNGRPEFEERLHARSRELGIEDSIDWLGYVNNEAKYEVYRSARVMVHPTIFDNNGMVAAEALCSGLPVVMYDLPALRHVYTTGCVKVPFGDKAAFAEAVVRLLSDNAHYDHVRPSKSQVEGLRSFWTWSGRVERFRTWLATL